MSTSSMRSAERKARSLFAYLKSGRRLFISEVGDELWWSDSFIMLKVDEGVTTLLADYNLEPEPMVCEIGRTIVRTDNKPAGMAELLARSTPKRGMVDVAPLEFGGRTLTVDTGSAVEELWSTDGTTVTHRLNTDLVARVQAAGGDRFRTVPPDTPDGLPKPLVRYNGRDPIGLLMPIRGVVGSLGIDLQSEQAAAA